MKKDIVIVGAGAAGLICAIEAGRRGRSVLILERSERIANKVRISGGGRCNFTNIDGCGDHYISRNPHFAKSALARFAPQEVIAMIEKGGIAYEERKEGQLFCRGSAEEIIRMLEKECASVGVEIRTKCYINSVRKNGHFVVATNDGIAESQSLVVATGGLSIPQVGATDGGFRIAEAFGLKTTPLRPGLVPLLFGKEDLDNYGELSGLSLRAAVSCNKALFDGKILFTHRGLSGPAILQISLYWKEGDTISIDLLPDTDIDALFLVRRRDKVKIENLLSEFLPARFAQKWCALNLQSKTVNTYSDKEFHEIARKLHGWRVVPAGTEGYAKAEVMAGGVDTNELSSKTMEAKKVAGLYFVGEVVDVTGQLGGFNLQWAWSSGYVAGQYV